MGEVDAGMVLGAFSYVTVLALILGLMGIGGVKVPFTPTSPTDPTGQSTTSANGTTLAPGTERQGFISAVVECTAFIVTAGIPLLLGADFNCSRNTVGSTFIGADGFFNAAGSFVDAFVGMLKFALSIFVFMWQLSTLQIPEIPSWFSIAIATPLWIMIAFIGFKAVRGTT